jgi:two-component system, NarL family, response regulator DesR
MPNDDRHQPRTARIPQACASRGRARLPTQTVSADILATVVRTVHGGGRYVDTQLAAEAISAGDSQLTAREANVLTLAAEGAPVDEIALRAALSPGTVRNYLSSAVGKVGAANRHEAARIARGHGWI